MIRASVEGPVGCHNRQNGIEVNVAGWSFEMPYAASPGACLRQAFPCFELPTKSNDLEVA